MSELEPLVEPLSNMFNSILPFLIPAVVLMTLAKWFLFDDFGRGWDGWDDDSDVSFSSHFDDESDPCEFCGHHYEVKDSEFDYFPKRTDDDKQKCAWCGGVI